tara:strand:+ start:284 stop:1117 length:834 start_codon:yes stop_codon:yes gene_type:complete
MIKILSKILKKILPENYYRRVKIIYDYLINFKSRNYILANDLKYNEELFRKLRFDIEVIKAEISKLNYLYNDQNLSWHYHLFVGLQKYFSHKKIKILEIGTLTGQFTNFISKVYKDSEVTTIDLDDADKTFTSTYGRDQKENLTKFLDQRKNNLDNKNIKFIKLNSINIKKFFSGKKFDLIWIDGDHLNPQITIDIINSLDLLDTNGIICVDDIIMDLQYKKNKYVSNEGFLTLNHLENNDVIKNYYLIKRINRRNFYDKKYISISVFSDNKNFYEF